MQAAQAHQAVGGPGTGACSDDLLLGALAACARITCHMVASAMGIEPRRIEVAVEGDLELRRTLGVDRDAQVGFEAIRLRLEVKAPDASADELEGLRVKTERYCTGLQTSTQPPAIAAEVVAG